MYYAWSKHLVIWTSISDSLLRGKLVWFYNTILTTMLWEFDICWDICIYLEFRVSVSRSRYRHGLGFISKGSFEIFLKIWCNYICFLQITTFLLRQFHYERRLRYISITQNCQNIVVEWVEKLASILPLLYLFD